MVDVSSLVIRVDSKEVKIAGAKELGKVRQVWWQG